VSVVPLLDDAQVNTADAQNVLQARPRVEMGSVRAFACVAGQRIALWEASNGYTAQL